MTTPAIQSPSLPAMTHEAVGAVRHLEARLMTMNQIPIQTAHLIHGGMYARTICIPAGAALTGAFIKLPTVLIVHGHVTVFTGNDEVVLTGYHVVHASAGRKTAFIAHADTHLTMVFPTDAQTVAEAEAEFTDETGLLMSRTSGLDANTIITGE